MGRISLSEMENYNSNSGGSFFQLKDDGDNARVRFLYKGIEDLTPYVVHEIELDGKRRYVNCLRSYDEPIDKCPFCSAQYKAIPKLFLKLFNEDTGECQIWERGKTYASRISNLAAHYNPLCNEVIEISRIGKKGDMQTKYEFLPLENSPVNLEDYEVQEPLGTIILDKTADEMQEFLQVGDFPTVSTQVANERQASQPQRRTPAGNTSRRAF